MNFEKHKGKHPISRKDLAAAMKESKKKNGKWREVKSKRDMIEEWGEAKCKKWLWRNSHMILKGGGPNALTKAKLQIYKSRHFVKLYIGT